MGEWGRPAPEGLTDTPAELAEAARLHLREKFLRAKVGVSGANFMVAETGTLVVVESEGNGRMCLTLPETLISVVGIEKIVPTWRDLEVFLQTLPRSSTAERMNPYTSTWTGTTDGDGPRTFHLVLLDNGRTDTLADEVGRQALRCIRCSACLNVCPVYERAGGHAYGSVYPGPIGAILSPQLRGTASEIDASLPYASSLCGACYEVCPVAIDIPEVLVHLRERVVEGGPVDPRGQQGRPEARKGHAAERAAMRAARWAFDHPGALRAGQRLASRTRRLHPGTLPGPGQAWSGTRDLPAVPGGAVPRLVAAHRDGGTGHATEVSSSGPRSWAGSGARSPDVPPDDTPVTTHRPSAPRLSARARDPQRRARPSNCSPRTWRTTGRSCTAAPPPSCPALLARLLAARGSASGARPAGPARRSGSPATDADPGPGPRGEHPARAGRGRQRRHRLRRGHRRDRHHRPGRRPGPGPPPDHPRPRPPHLRRPGPRTRSSPPCRRPSNASTRPAR